MEIWKKIEGYANYKASNLGNVKNIKTNRVLKNQTDSDGYYHINLCNNGICKVFKVHRIVSILFLKKEFERDYVNHLNGIKTDNNIKNLEWVNSRENNNHRFLNKKTTSAYTGVSTQNRGKTWNSAITFDKKTKHLGCFKTELEAYQARVNFEKENNIINKYL